MAARMFVTWLWRHVKTLYTFVAAHRWSPMQWLNTLVRWHSPEIFTASTVGLTWITLTCTWCTLQLVGRQWKRGMPWLSSKRKGWSGNAVIYWLPEGILWLDVSWLQRVQKELHSTITTFSFTFHRLDESHCQSEIILQTGWGILNSISKSNTWYDNRSSTLLN